MAMGLDIYDKHKRMRGHGLHGSVIGWFALVLGGVLRCRCSCECVGCVSCLLRVCASKCVACDAMLKRGVWRVRGVFVVLGVLAQLG